MNWNDLPLILFSAGAGSISAYVGVRVALVRLETEVSSALERLNRIDARTLAHSEDLLVHDLELSNAMAKLELPRAVRQRERERWS